MIVTERAITAGTRTITDADDSANSKKGSSRFGDFISVVNLFIKFFYSSKIACCERIEASERPNAALSICEATCSFTKPLCLQQTPTQKIDPRPRLLAGS